MARPSKALDSTRLTLRLSKSEKEALERLAARSGRSTSDLARIAIAALLADAKKQGSITVRIDVAESNP